VRRAEYILSFLKLRNSLKNNINDAIIGVCQRGIKASGKVFQFPKIEQFKPDKKAVMYYNPYLKIGFHEFIFFQCVVLGFELRASLFLERHSIA
jgi:hypothetical protein